MRREASPHARRPGSAPRVAAAGIACWIALLAACAPARAPAPGVPAPRHPEFVFPSVPPATAGGGLTERLQRGWQFLQAGDLKRARTEFGRALRADAGFYPADTGLAYVSLADRNYGDALARFERVLGRVPRYVPALVGRAEALAADGRSEEAIGSFQAALAVDPSVPDVRRRLDLLVFRRQQQWLGAARQAVDARRYDEAAGHYAQAIAASPDSPFLYRELAGVERKRGRAADALVNLRKAVALDSTDSRALAQIGELLEEQGDLAGAADAYGQAQAVEPGDDLATRLDRVRAVAALARLPAEYRGIAGLAQVTRGDLAALIAVRLPAVVQSSPRRDGVVLTDTRGHWAAPWILAVVRAGLIDPYPNHAFVPRGVIRRLDLAEVVRRVLEVIAVRRPGRSSEWQAAPPRIVDLSQGHLGYAAAAMAVGSGVMPLVEGANFRPARPVSGAEATDVVGRLEVLSR